MERKAAAGVALKTAGARGVAVLKGRSAAGLHSDAGMMIERKEKNACLANALAKEGKMVGGGAPEM